MYLSTGPDIVDEANTTENHERQFHLSPLFCEHLIIFEK